MDTEAGETAAAPTILDLKLSFLRTQILALSKPLSLPPNYQQQSAASSAENAPLPAAAIDAALQKLNEAIRKHVKMAYSGQAQRHVAEQIDRLYWEAGGMGNTGGGGTSGEDALMRGADLSLEQNISRLDDTWEDDAGTDADDADGSRHARYAELTESLKSMDARRKELQERIARYKRFKEALEPFENATETVQPNVVGREGELEKELERMRLLVARVRGRVEALPERVDGEEEMDVSVDLDEGERVAALF